jgi:hypothetical protein
LSRTVAWRPSLARPPPTANLERFTTAATPAILNLPDAAWINPPIQETQQNKTVQQTAA